jgi:hypothetical protein
MAIKTGLLASFQNDLVRYEFDYDDAPVPPVATVFRCRNDSARSCKGRLWLIDDPTRDFPDGSFIDPSLAHITPAHVTESFNLPTQQARKFNLTIVDHRGNPIVINLGHELTWPAA